jgi:hypothetical protein
MADGDIAIASLLWYCWVAPWVGEASRLDVGELVGIPDLKIFILLSLFYFFFLVFFISILFECLNPV